MCGIAGSLDLSFATSPQRDSLMKMAAALAHRGPDANGTFISGPCGLAHARLSIVDLGGGAQPMSTVDGALTITFNGEIFNYVELRQELEALGLRFATSSDTEVILQAYAAWGDASVERFNGDFAFALWDSRRRRLFCARDRAGVRPFFYARAFVDGATRLLFASEVKALFAGGAAAALDVRGLNEALVFWSARAPQTVWRDVTELPAAHTLVIDAHGMRTKRYWELSYDVDESLGDDDDRAADELLTILDDAVRIRLRADVPVGSYLSGGLDSSVITALARRHVPSLSTFSLAFEEASFDESSFQESVAAFLGTQHRTVRMSNDDVGASFPEVVRHAETPLVRTAPAPLMKLAGLVRESGMKVVLTGEGSDEILGGYDIFKEARVRRFCARQPSSQIRPLLLRRLYPWMPSLQKQPTAFLRKFFFADGDALADPLFSHLPRFKLGEGIRSLFADDVARELAAHDPLADLRATLPRDFSSWDDLARAQYLESTILLPGYLLAAQGDRMAMARSVEARFPFLDPRVIAFASRLPARSKLRVLDEKFLLKRAAASLVPPAVLARKKQPYRAPDAQAFFPREGRPAAHSFVEEALSQASVQSTGIFDAASVERLVARVRRACRDGGDVRARDGMAIVFILSTQLCARELIDRPAQRRPAQEQQQQEQNTYVDRQ